MDDACTHAWRRLAAIRAQEAALEKRRRRDMARLHRIGQRALDRALRPLRLVKHETILAEQATQGDRQWKLGIYRGARIESPPEGPGRPWHVVIHLRSVLKTGKPGKHVSYRTLSGATPAEAIERLRVVGAVAKPKGKR